MADTTDTFLLKCMSMFSSFTFIKQPRFKISPCVFLILFLSFYYPYMSSVFPNLQAFKDPGNIAVFSGPKGQ